MFFRKADKNKKAEKAKSISDAINSFMTVPPPKRLLRGSSIIGDMNCAKWFADITIANDTVLASGLNLFPMSETHAVIKILKPTPLITEAMQ